jgi:hypothetical protein
MHTLQVSPSTYRLLEQRARREQCTADEIAETLLHEQLSAEQPDDDFTGCVRLALGLDREEWDLLHSQLPPADRLREQITRHLPPHISLSADVVAMRDEW